MCNEAGGLGLNLQCQREVSSVGSECRAAPLFQLLDGGSPACAAAVAAPISKLCVLYWESRVPISGTVLAGWIARL